MSIVEQIQKMVSELPPAQQQSVLEFAQLLQRNLNDEDRANGLAGWQLSATVLAPEDFSEWEKSRD